MTSSPDLQFLAPYEFPLRANNIQFFHTVGYQILDLNRSRAAKIGGARLDGPASPALAVPPYFLREP
jgi:hypothetical protein